MGPFFIKPMNNRCSTIGLLKFEAADARRNIQACLRLDAHRLQIDSLFKTANQNIGSEANPNRRFSRSACVGTLQSALFCLARRKYGPGQNCLSSHSNVKPKLARIERVTEGVETSLQILLKEECEEVLVDYRETINLVIKHLFFLGRCDIGQKPLLKRVLRRTSEVNQQVGLIVV